MHQEAQTETNTQSGLPNIATYEWYTVYVITRVPSSLQLFI